MKIVILLTVACCLQTLNKGFAQSLSLSLKNSTLETVFKEIRKQTAYTFIYTKEELSEAHRVTLSVKNESLQKVLGICFDGQPLSYSIEEKHIIVKKKEQDPAEQQLTHISQLHIRGRVVDENANGVEAATVTVKGTTNAASTNASGYFELKKVDAGAQLVVTGINIETGEITVAAKTDLIISVATRVSQNESITIELSTGYQKIPKERSTGSFSQIGNAALNLQTGSNIVNRLNGVTTGILFDNNINHPPFTVRGLSTINGPKNPLIVIDNFPYDGDINNINPNDIENVTILKDAAAASIWGTRAGNGVIVITTRKGKYNQKLKIEINSNLTVSPAPDLSYAKPMSSGDFIDLEKLLFSKGFYNNQVNNSSRPALSPVVELLIKQASGGISQQEADAKIDQLKNIDVRKSFADYLYQKSFNQQYALNFNGGSTNATYAFSAGFDHNISNLSAIFDRINLRADNSFRPLKNLEVFTSLLFTQSTSVSGKPAYGSVVLNGKSIYPYATFRDDAGKSLPLNIYRQTYTDTAGSGKLLDWKFYPLEDYKHNTRRSELSDLLFNAGIKYSLFKTLQLETRIQGERQTILSKNLMDINSFATRDMINRFTQIDPSTGSVSYIVPKGSVLNQSNGNLYSYTGRAQAEYQKHFGKGQLAIIAGAEIKQAKNTGNTFGVYGYNENILTGSNVDYVNSYKTYITGSKQNIPNNVSFSEKTNRFVSMYSNAAFTYANRYTLSASVRKDASNLFGVNSNQKGVPLWSAGAAWDISKESFFKSSFLNYLKLRGSFGYSGNVDQSWSALTTLRYFSSAPNTNLPFANVASFGNPSLRWDKVQTANIGVDFAALKSRISGSIEAYRKKGLDLFGISPIDYTTGLGVNYLVINNAEMKGKGLDVELNFKILDGRTKWITSLNYSNNSNQVSRYNLTSTQGSIYISSGSTVTPVTGEAVYSIVSYRWGGLSGSGDPRGYLNGNLSSSYSDLTGSKTQVKDLSFSGSALPTNFGNISNSFSWKQFSATINIVYKFGYYFRRQSINYTDLVNAYLTHSDYSLRWQKAGDENLTNVPAFVYPLNNTRDNFYTNSEVLVTKGDHIRLQFVTLSYNVPVKKFNHAPNGLQLYLNAANLGILWRANPYGIDPDYNSSIPPSKSFSLGIKAKF